MKKLFLVLSILLYSASLFAQRTVSVFPNSHDQSLPHTVFDAPEGDERKYYYQLQPPTGATANGAYDVKRLLFKMPGSVDRNSYSGNADVIVRTDTTSISGLAVGDRDSLFVSIYPLYYDHVTKTYESSSEADKDSIVVGGSTGAGINWGSTVSDLEILLRDDADVQLCDAVQVNIYAGRGGQVDVQVQLRISETR
jgi:hypothetical protein